MEFLLSLTVSLLVLKGTIIRQLVLFLARVKKGQTIAGRTVKYERSIPEAAQRILLIGDSTVFGTGAESPNQSIAGYFGQDFPQASITNLGKNGLHIHELPHQFRLVDRQHFDLVIILIGGNDVVHFTKLKTIPPIMPSIITQAKELSDQAMLLSQGNIGNAPLLPNWLSRLCTHRARQLREIFQTASREAGIMYCDLFVERQSDHWRHHPRQYYCEDLFHPNGYGYREWYRSIRQTMAEVKITL